ncbi:hypothetical protein BS35_003990 [Actinomadura glauciflava]|nr:hypothetical protein [Actinomadura glauciflava]
MKAPNAAMTLKVRPPEPKNAEIPVMVAFTPVAPPIAAAMPRISPMMTLI